MRHFLRSKSTFLYLPLFILVALFMMFFLQTTQYQTIELKIPSKENSIKAPNIIYIDNFPVKTGSISSRYGMRKDPFTGKHKMHSGLDIAALLGSEVQPLGEGEVIFSGKKAGYGISVEVRHGNTIVTRYAHLKRTLVKTGQMVSKSDVIAEVGNSGRSTGPHLHIEIAINGKKVDPQIFLVNKLASK